MLDLVRPKRAKKHHLHFRRDKKEIPSRGTDLAIKSGAIERLDHAPVPRVGLTLQPKELRPFRHQDRADLNFLGHGRLLPRAHLIVASSWLRRRCKPLGWTDPLLLDASKARPFSFEILCRMAHFHNPSQKELGGATSQFKSFPIEG